MELLLTDAQVNGCIYFHQVQRVGLESSLRLEPGSFDKLPWWSLDEAGFLLVATCLILYRESFIGRFSSVRRRPALCHLGPVSLSNSWLPV